MEAVAENLGDRDNLTEAIDAVIPWDPSERLIEHPFQNDFSLLEITSEDTAIYLSESLRGVVSEEAPEGEPEYGKFFSSLFRFKAEENQGGVLGLLWMREIGNWRIISWEVFEQ